MLGVICGVAFLLHTFTNQNKTIRLLCETNIYLSRRVSLLFISYVCLTNNVLNSKLIRFFYFKKDSFLREHSLHFPSSFCRWRWKTNFVATVRYGSMLEQTATHFSKIGYFGKTWSQLLPHVQETLQFRTEAKNPKLHTHCLHHHHHHKMLLFIITHLTKLFPLTLLWERAE